MKRVLIIAGLVLMLMLVRRRPVLAHAELSTAVPAPGSLLPESPEAVVLTFTEPILTGGLTLFDTAFRATELLRTTLDEAALVVTAQLPALPAGRYTVQWRAVAVDGHVISGSYAFAVDPDAPDLTVVRSNGWYVAAVGLVAALLLTGAAVRVRRRRQVDV